MTKATPWMAIAAAAMLWAGAAAGADEIIGRTGELLADSHDIVTTDQAGNGGMYQMLNSGDYTVTAPAKNIDISSLSTGNENLAMTAGTSLTMVGGNNVTALTVNNFTMDGGSLHLTGGTNTGTSGYAYGLLVKGDFVQNNGSVTAIADANGKVSGAYSGMTVNGTYTQNGGDLHVYGAKNYAGLFTSDFVQTAGTVYAMGGSSIPGTGLSATNASFSGNVVLQRGGDGRAMYIGSTSSDTLTFASSSTLTLDFGGSGALPFIQAKKVNIEEGAKLAVLNTAQIPTGVTKHNFIRSTDVISGEFEFPDSATLQMSIEKNKFNNTYTIHFDRTGTAGSVSGSNAGVGSNARAFLTSLDGLYGNTAALAGMPHLSNDLTLFDNLNDDKEIADFANYMAAKYTPIDAVATASNLASSVNSVTQQSMVRNVFAPTGGSGMTAAAAGSGNAVASLASPGDTIRSVWLTPLAQWSRTRALSNEYSRASENIFGAGLGFGIRQENNFAAGISFHYLRSNLNSRTTDVDSNIYGLNLFGRKYLVDCPSYAPFVEAGLGYSYVDGKQVRKILNNRSKPESHIFNANLALGADLFFGNLTLTPKLGLDYSHVNTRSYRESGPNGLSVSPDNFDSLQGVVGVGVKSQVTDCLYFTANAAYRHEFADRNATATSSFTTVPDVLFVTAGERRSRSSGDFGAGIGWQARHDLLVGLNYDLNIGQKRHSQSLSAQLALDF